MQQQNNNAADRQKYDMQQLVGNTLRIGVSLVW